MKKLLLLLLIAPVLGFAQFDFLPFDIDGVQKIYDDEFYIVPDGKLLLLYGDNATSFRFKDGSFDYSIESENSSRFNFYVPPNYGVKPYGQPRQYRKSICDCSFTLWGIYTNPCMWGVPKTVGATTSKFFGLAKKAT